jgi:hypothetical protein
VRCPGFLGASGTIAPQIGTADVKILFGMPPTELYKTTLAIPLHAQVGEDLMPADLTIPMTIASTFWAFGVKSLELEVMGNGSGGGPYRISIPLIVIPEPIDLTWWTWAMPPTAFWKSSYAVTGTFSNLGLVSMTLTALTALEHPTDVMGTGQDKTAAPRAAVFTAPAMPGASVTAAFVRFQDWTWLAQGTFVEVAPSIRTFSYVASFSVTDIFGNAYPVIVSAPTLVTVMVSNAKFSKLGYGRASVAIGLVFLAAAAIASQVGGYGWIAAIVLAAIGMALIIAGTFLLYEANDPPIPDFRDREAALIGSARLERSQRRRRHPPRGTDPGAAGRAGGLGAGSRESPQGSGVGGVR